MRTQYKCRIANILDKRNNNKDLFLRIKLLKKTLFSTWYEVYLSITPNICNSQEFLNTTFKIEFYE